MSGAERIAISAAIGGTAEALGGGKFANGAVTGAYVMALNHMGHQGDGDGEGAKSNNQNSGTEKQEKPSPVVGYSLDATITMPVGFTLEFGEYIDLASGKSSYFWAWGPAFGYEYSASFNEILVIPKMNFNFSDLQGLGVGGTLNYLFTSASFFTNSKPAIPTNTLFESYWGVKGGVGVGLGGSYQPSTTTSFIPKANYPMPPSNSILNSNAFFRR